MALLWLLASIILEPFRTAFNFSNIVIVATSMAIVSLGQTYVILTGGFDLSVGTAISLTTAVASLLMVDNVLFAITMAMAVGISIGAVNGVGVAKIGVNPFIMTLGTMGLAAGLALYLRPYPGGVIPRTYVSTVLYEAWSLPAGPLLILLVTAFMGEFILQRRNIGREIYAVGGSEMYAKMAGISTQRVKFLVYTFSGLTAALAGLFLTAVIACGDARSGDPFLFDSITAVIIGGTLITGGVGDYKGTIGAVLILASLGRIFNLVGVNPWYEWIFKGLLVVVIVAVQYFTRIRRMR